MIDGRRNLRSEVAARGRCKRSTLAEAQRADRGLMVTARGERRARGNQSPKETGIIDPREEKEGNKKETAKGRKEGEEGVGGGREGDREEERLRESSGLAVRSSSTSEKKQLGCSGRATIDSRSTNDDAAGYGAQLSYSSCFDAQRSSCIWLLKVLARLPSSWW